MTDFGRKVGLGDMLKSIYDPNADEVIAVAQTEADMKKSVYDPNDDGVIVVAQTEADMKKSVYDSNDDGVVDVVPAHKATHDLGGTDELAVSLVEDPYHVHPCAFQGFLHNRQFDLVSNAMHQLYACPDTLAADKHYMAPVRLPHGAIVDGLHVNAWTLDDPADEVTIKLYRSDPLTNDHDIMGEVQHLAQNARLTKSDLTINHATIDLANYYYQCFMKMNAHGQAYAASLYGCWIDWH
ncbi:hypothetical protein ES703_31495 [subsurface metagenome]